MSSFIRSPRLVHELVSVAAQRAPDNEALVAGKQSFTYAEVLAQTERAGAAFAAAGCGPGDRVAIYLPKRAETVVAMMAASYVGAAYVPVNPALKQRQVGHILLDSAAMILVTSSDRWAQVSSRLPSGHALRCVLLVDSNSQTAGEPDLVPLQSWQDLCSSAPAVPPVLRPDTDMAAILYTSGSTGNPKGVVLSHQNIVLGAESVASYLGNTAGDRILAVLPLSFDYGMSQVTTAFLSTATVVLQDYLLPRDVLRAMVRHRITGLAAVPPLWMQLDRLQWPEEIQQHLRYITNSGGAMPVELTRAIAARLPSTSIFLMYGLTEAFRSTYLDPQLVVSHAQSIGRAIPNSEVIVVRPDGQPCSVDEVGELVHRGPLVAQGYWNDPERTAQRFRADPLHPQQIPLSRPAVWSGDLVREDAEGLLYFVSRKDEMIKTSGYRVSPTEVEDCLLSVHGVAEAACTGVPHPELGQAIVVFVVVDDNTELSSDEILRQCRVELPNYMVPHSIYIRSQLPRNQNGKIDRKLLRADVIDTFAPQNPGQAT